MRRYRPSRGEVDAAGVPVEREAGGSSCAGGSCTGTEVDADACAACSGAWTPAGDPDTALVLATGVRPTGYAGGAALATVGLAAVDAHAYVNHHKPVMILQSTFLG